MNHPIPAPRRPVDTRRAHATGTTHLVGTARPTETIFTPAPRRPASTTGPACASCTHPTCRAQRARTLPRLGGHRSEYSREHAQAAQVQARYRHLLIYFGESTQSFWIATPTGLEEAHDLDTLLLKLRPHTDPPTVRPWAQTTGTRIPALA